MVRFPVAIVCVALHSWGLHGTPHVQQRWYYAPQWELHDRHSAVGGGGGCMARFCMVPHSCHGASDGSCNFTRCLQSQFCMAPHSWYLHLYEATIICIASHSCCLTWRLTTAILHGCYFAGHLRTAILHGPSDPDFTWWPTGAISHGHCNWYSSHNCYFAWRHYLYGPTFAQHLAAWRLTAAICCMVHIPHTC